MENKLKKYTWGYEILWANQDDYAGKVKIFEKPEKTEMVFHKNKSLTYFVNQGTFNIKWIDTSTGKVYEQNLPEGGVKTIEPLTPYTIECTSKTGSLSEVNNGEKTNDTFYLMPKMEDNNVSKTD
jgi:hypothetical protein